MQSSPKIDFANPALFIGHEIQLAGDLTVFGHDLPEFRAWAYDNGAINVRHVTDPNEYFANDHELVAHQFGRRVTLGRIKEIKSRIQSLLGRAQRLVLFIDIETSCTIEAIRQALRDELPHLTFRIVFPRGLYKTSGVRVILAENRRPHIFLFLSSKSMAGKTESALAHGAATGITVIHGDEYYAGILTGDIPTAGDLRRRIHALQDGTPFNRVLFGEFLTHIPAFEEKQDIAFDFLVPHVNHLAVMEYFDALGFFPTLSLMTADQKRLTAERQQARRDQNALREDAEALRREVAALREVAESHRIEAETLRNMVSWRITAPLRLLGRRAPLLAKVGRRWFNLAGRALTRACAISRRRVTSIGTPPLARPPPSHDPAAHARQEPDR